MGDSPFRPFQPGARVCVIRGCYGGPKTYTEDFVLKLYKNGNFTLKSDPRQQWSTYATPRDAVPTARMTGDGYHRPSLKLWNEKADAEIRADIAATIRRKRWNDVRYFLDRLPYERVTDAAIDLFEQAIAALNPAKEPTNG